MKIPMTLMQEITNVKEFLYRNHKQSVNNIIERRSKPFTPDVLADYGFKKEGKYGYRLNQIEILFQSCIYINTNTMEWTFPLWKIIDDFENDLARVMEVLK